MSSLIVSLLGGLLFGQIVLDESREERIRRARAEKVERAADTAAPITGEEWNTHSYFAQYGRDYEPAVSVIEQIDSVARYGNVYTGNGVTIIFQPPEARNPRFPALVTMTDQGGRDVPLVIGDLDPKRWYWRALDPTSGYGIDLMAGDDGFVLTIHLPDGVQRVILGPAMGGVTADAASLSSSEARCTCRRRPGDTGTCPNDAACDKSDSCGTSGTCIYVASLGSD